MHRSVDVLANINIICSLKFHNISDIHNRRVTISIARARLDRVHINYDNAKRKKKSRRVRRSISISLRGGERVRKLSLNARTDISDVHYSIVWKFEKALENYETVARGQSYDRWFTTRVQLNPVRQPILV